ncbi:hypothetical protein ACJJIC_16570 [Microbulbifer sp. ANSA002]|uniref:hypothetical protein n=1 Tax=unclassified Microbulbifer TaxID=2619833 RepID=UPI004042BB90
MMSFIKVIFKARLSFISAVLGGAFIYLCAPLALSFGKVFLSGPMASPEQISGAAYFITGASVFIFGVSFIFGVCFFLSKNIFLWGRITEEFLFVFYISQLLCISILIAGLFWFDFEPSFAAEYIGITVVMFIFSFQNSYRKFQARS